MNCMCTMSAGSWVPALDRSLSHSLHYDDINTCLAVCIEQVLRKPAAATISAAASGMGLDELKDFGALEAPKKLAGHNATSASDGSAHQTQVIVAGNEQGSLSLPDNRWCEVCAAS